MDEWLMRSQEKTGQMMGTGQETAEAAKEKAYEAKDKGSETAQSAKERAHEGTEKTGGYMQESAEAAKEKASRAAQSAGDTGQAGKEKTGSVLQKVKSSSSCCSNQWSAVSLLLFLNQVLFGTGWGTGEERGGWGCSCCEKLAGHGWWWQRGGGGGCSSRRQGLDQICI